MAYKYIFNKTFSTQYLVQCLHTQHPDSLYGMYLHPQPHHDIYTFLDKLKFHNATNLPSKKEKKKKQEMPKYLKLSIMDITIKIIGISNIYHV